MKKNLIISFVLFLLFLNANSVLAFDSLRCGDNLISVGQLKNEVLITCGEPSSKEEIGYIDRIEPDNKRIRVMKIEEWIIEINNHGTIYYHSLIFEGNKLTEIKSAGEKKAN